MKARQYVTPETLTVVPTAGIRIRQMIVKFRGWLCRVANH